MKKTIEDNFRDWEAFVFGFGYDSGEPHVLGALKSVLSVIPVEGTYNYKDLEAAVGLPTTWLLINALCHANVIEYGSSPRFGWLTKEGRALRDFVIARELNVLCEIVCSKQDTPYEKCDPQTCLCEEGGYDEPCSNPFWFTLPKT